MVSPTVSLTVTPKRNKSGLNKLVLYACKDGFVQMDQSFNSLVEFWEVCGQTFYSYPQYEADMAVILQAHF